MIATIWQAVLQALGSQKTAAASRPGRFAPCQPTDLLRMDTGNTSAAGESTATKPAETGRNTRGACLSTSPHLGVTGNKPSQQPVLRTSKQQAAAAGPNSTEANAALSGPVSQPTPAAQPSDSCSKQAKARPGSRAASVVCSPSSVSPPAPACCPAQATALAAAPDPDGKSAAFSKVTTGAKPAPRPTAHLSPALVYGSSAPLPGSRASADAPAALASVNSSPAAAVSDCHGGDHDAAAVIGSHPVKPPGPPGLALPATSPADPSLVSNPASWHGAPHIRSNMRCRDSDLTDALASIAHSHACFMRYHHSLQRTNGVHKSTVFIEEIVDEAPATGSTPDVRPAAPAVLPTSAPTVSPAVVRALLAAATAIATPPTTLMAAPIPGIAPVPATPTAAASAVMASADTHAKHTLHRAGSHCLSPAGLESRSEAEADSIVEKLVTSFGPDSPDEVRCTSAVSLVTSSDVPRYDMTVL